MKKIVLVDIDGTLSKVGERVYEIQKDPPDWDAFYNRCGEDEPVKNVIDLADMLSISYHIVLCTGRRESTRVTTVDWLVNNGLMYWKALLMRPDGDHRHDTILKPEMVEKAGISLSDIAFVLEDRNSVVKKWRELGLTCLQVAEGDF